jgi:glycosyltransferase involved in cell wall biosynthesis
MLLRTLSARALSVVRRSPVLHWPVHQIARLIVRTGWGEKYVREVLGPDAQTDAQYREWIAVHDTLSDEDRAAIAGHIARMTNPLVISVVMPAYATPEPLIRAAIASIQAQLYPHWQLCIADDGSPGEALWRVLADYARSDARIRVIRRPENGQITAATNSALALATGDFVAFMDHDDLLTEHALYHVAAALEAHPETDLIYSDEDKIDERGRRSQPYFKTGWNAELMLGQNMVNHLAVYRRSLLEDLGGLREGFEGAQDHDLALRAAERIGPERIRHIPWVLYHWRWRGRQGSFSRRWAEICADSARHAVAEHLARTDQDGAFVSNQPGAARWLRVHRALPDPQPLVSIIVPTRDRLDLFARCAEGVLHGTDYEALEFLIVDNGSVEPETLAHFEALKADPRVRILPAPGPFNFSALMNRAVAEARGEIILLLNNDISMIGSDWLAEMVSHAVRPNVGAVGARLLYPDGTIQHAGVVLGTGGVAGHLHVGAPGDYPGYQGHLKLARNVSAVTAACLAMRRSVWDEVAGMDAERLTVAFNDVDLCLKVRAAGYDIVWTPFAELFHHESASRGLDLAPAAAARFQSEIDTMRERWGPVLDNDPFYGPVFDNRFSNYRPADEPRRVAPWIKPTPTPDHSRESGNPGVF